MVEGALVVLWLLILMVGPIAFVAFDYLKPLVADGRWLDPYDQSGAYKKAVLDFINNAARRHLTIVRGEMPDTVYDGEVADALRCAHKRGVDITIVCGPIVFRSQDRHPVIRLAEEGIIKLYYSDQGEPVHFLEAEGTRLQLEGRHNHGARSRPVLNLMNSKFIADEYRFQVLDSIKNNRLRSVHKEGAPFIFMTPGEYNKLEENLKNKGLQPEKLSGDRIRALLNN